MKGNLVITIGRQCGSGGKVVGQKIAEQLGIKCYDKELLALAAKNSGICEELFETHDEKPTSSFLYSLVMDTYALGRTTSTSTYMDMPINHKVFLAQVDTLKQLAEEESFVIIGRCADYALAECKNVVTVFIATTETERVERLQKTYDLSKEKAKEVAIKTDKKRSGYYNYYSGKKWGDARSYDLCINTATVGIDGAVKTIIEFAKIKTGLL